MKKAILAAMMVVFSVTVSFAVVPDKLYYYKVNDIDGNEKNLEDYKGKVILVVNVASQCGFTEQYKNLQKLYESYKDNGLEILGFPCNQFGEQEPGTEIEIKSFCATNFNVTFPMFSKIEVNGENTAPLYVFLKENGTIEVALDDEKRHRLFKRMEEKIAPREIGGQDIRWNFTKFLVDSEGNVIRRFEPTATFSSIEKVIKSELELE